MKVGTILIGDRNKITTPKHYIETVVFVPFTPNGRLCKSLQNEDNKLAQMFRQPRVRFVERKGTTINEELGASDPWSGEYFCGRKMCKPCETRITLAAEVEEMRERGEKRPKDENSKTIPGCTTESVAYTLECKMCRDAGVPYSYRGETSRSAFQRGAEHTDDVERGILKNPMVQHFWEIHDGMKQEFMMRITSKKRPKKLT